MNAALLTAFERCPRSAYYSARWERHRIRPIEAVRRAVLTGLMDTETSDHGELAGEEFMTLAHHRGLDVVDTVNLYRSAINHASISDLVTTAIRKASDPPWLSKGDACTDSTGSYLRRFLPVTSWTDERAQSEIRSWYGIGTVCEFKLPMQMVVAVLGPVSGGRRTGRWSKGLLHPQQGGLRFKLRKRSTVDGFTDTWIPCWKEEHAEISREKWLSAMYSDGVLQESLFVVHIPVPGEAEVNAVRDLAARHQERLSAMVEKTQARSPVLPDRQLSSCDGPLAACPFRVCCWSSPESGPEAGGFDALP